MPSPFQSNLFFVIMVKWFLYLIFSKRSFNLLTAVSPQKFPVSTQLKLHNSNILIFLITALPDEPLCVVFKYLSLKEIKNKLRLVCRRWRLVSESDMLWSTVCLDEWGISYPIDEHLETITKHTGGLRYFSVAYIEVKLNPFKEPQATVHSSHGLKNVNLSGQSITNLSFLQGTCQLENLTLNDCFALKDISPISFCKKLTFLSLNGMIVSERELLECVLPLSNLFSSVWKETNYP